MVTMSAFNGPSRISPIDSWIDHCTRGHPNVTYFEFGFDFNSLQAFVKLAQRALRELEALRVEDDVNACHGVVGAAVEGWEGDAERRAGLAEAAGVAVGTSPNLGRGRA